MSVEFDLKLQRVLDEVSVQGKSKTMKREETLIDFQLELKKWEG